MKEKYIRSAMKLLQDTKEEKGFIEDMLFALDSITSYEERENSLYYSLSNTLASRYESILRNENKGEDLAIKSIRFSEGVYTGKLSVFIENTAIRFKVRDYLNNKGYSASLDVENNKSILDITTLNSGFESLMEVCQQLKELREWSIGYLETLKEQVSENELPEAVKNKAFSKELPDEHRILVKVHPANISDFKSLFKSAKWESDSKVWRISNINSNKEKLNELDQLLSIRDKQENVDFHHKNIFSIPLVFEGKKYELAVYHALSHPRNGTVEDSIDLCLMAPAKREDWSPDFIKSFSNEMISYSSDEERNSEQSSLETLKDTAIDKAKSIIESIIQGNLSLSDITSDDFALPNNKRKFSI